jgi:hypothetical protein
VIVATALLLPLADLRSQTTMTAPEPSPLLVWVSGGLGPATFMRTEGIALRAAVNTSYRRGVFMVRRTAAFEGIDGYASTDETAVLAGVRVGGSHFYIIPALGAGNTSWEDNGPCSFSTCTPTQALSYQGKSRALAFDIGLHASKWLFGFAINVSATTGPANGQLFTVALSPEIGWFGR